MTERVKNFRKGQIIPVNDGHAVSYDTEIVNLTSRPIAIALRTSRRTVTMKDSIGKHSLNVIEIYEEPESFKIERLGFTLLKNSLRKIDDTMHDLQEIKDYIEETMQHLDIE